MSEKLTKAQRERLAELPQMAFVTDRDLSDLIAAGMVEICDSHEYRRGVLTSVYRVTEAGEQLIGRAHD